MIATKFFGQRFNALLEGVPLVGQRYFSALRGDRLGDALGNRAIVRDAHDQTAFACHQCARWHVFVALVCAHCVHLTLRPMRRAAVGCPLIRTVLWLRYVLYCGFALLFKL